MRFPFDPGSDWSVWCNLVVYGGGEKGRWSWILGFNDLVEGKCFLFCALFLPLSPPLISVCLSTYLSLCIALSLYCSAFPLLSVSFLSLFSFNLYLSLSLLLKAFLLRELSSGGLPEICDTQFDFHVTWSVAIDFYSSHFGLNISAGFCSVLCFPDLPMYV